MTLKWCCDFDQLALPVAAVVSQNLLLQWFLGLLLCMASVWRLLWAPIFKFAFISSSFFRSLSLSLDTYTYIFFILFYFLLPSNITQTNKILRTNRIENLVTIVLQPEGKNTVVLDMVGLHQIFIYTSEGNIVVSLSKYTSCRNNIN